MKSCRCGKAGVENFHWQNKAKGKRCTLCKECRNTYRKDIYTPVIKRIDKNTLKLQSEATSMQW